MLLREQRGGHEHRHLLARLHGDERRAQRDLGLAEAHVAADDAVHRLLAGEVGDDVGDGQRLVRRLFERELCGERTEFGFAGRDLLAVARGAARIQVQQFGGRIADPLRRLPCVAPLPASLPRLVQRRFLGGRTGIAADQVPK